jgi:imidazolonepropionase-like amidohydrolase
MKRWAIVVVSSGAVLLLLALVILWMLRPPHLDAPARSNGIFRDVTLVEAGRPARVGRTLRIEDGFIAEISEGSNPVEATSAANDGTGSFGGLYVSPGLTDLHVHYPPRIAVGNAELWSLLLLSHGVTSIRETGSIDGSIFAVRDAIRAGAFPGPRIFACGAMLDGERPSFPSNRVVATAAEARDAVEELAGKGADCIKAYNMLEPKALEAITETAAAHGLPVIGHAPHSVPFEESGLVDLQHGTGAVIVDRARVGRSDFLDVDWKSMDEDRIAYVAGVSRELDIAHTPTLVNARMRRLLADDKLAKRAMEEDSGLRHLPRFWAGAWSAIWGAPFGSGDGPGKAHHAIARSRHEFFRARQAAMTVGLHARGVRIHAGTDTLMPYVAPGSSLLGELDDLVAAGIDAEAVWAIATRGAGRSLSIEGLGRLEVGAPADLVFTRSDPTGNLAAFREVEAVVADGRLYRRAELDAMLAKADAHFRGAFYSTVMDLAMAIVRGTFAPEDGGRENLGAAS